MKIEYDQKSDLLYLRLDSRAQDVVNRRVAEDIVLDVGEGDRIIGIEITNASRNIDLHQVLPVLFEKVG